MIYVLAGTQLATLLALCFIVSWVIEDKNNTNSVLAQLKGTSEERLERVMTSHTDQLKAVFEMMAEKAFIEREQLLNRIQAPDMAIAATPSSQVGQVSVEDDESDQPLQVPADESPIEGRIPMNDMLVRPAQPVSAMGPFEPSYEDEEEEQDDGLS